MLEAIISSQFRTGSGSDEVRSREYELYNTLDIQQPLSAGDSEKLIPGMNITMAFVVGRYQRMPMNCCPRPGCRNHDFLYQSAGGKTWCVDRSLDPLFQVC